MSCLVWTVLSKRLKYLKIKVLTLFSSDYSHNVSFLMIPITVDYLKTSWFKELVNNSRRGKKSLGVKCHLTKVKKNTGNNFWSFGTAVDLQRAVLSHPQAGTNGRSVECPSFSTLPVQWDQSGWLVVSFLRWTVLNLNAGFCSTTDLWSKCSLFAFLPNFHMYICHQRARTAYVSLFSWEHWNLSVLLLFGNTRGKFAYN